MQDNLYMYNGCKTMVVVVVHVCLIQFSVDLLTRVCKTPTLSQSLWQLFLCKELAAFVFIKLST